MLIGYVTTTQIKFLLNVYDTALTREHLREADESVKELFGSIHRAYVGYVMNPFSPLHGSISSSRFDEELEHIVKQYNQSHRHDPFDTLGY